MKNRLSVSKNPEESYYSRYSQVIADIRESLFSAIWYEIKDDVIFHKAYFSSEVPITPEFLEDKYAQADQKIAELENLSQEIKQESKLNNAQKELLIQNLQKAIWTFQYHQNAMYLESEKAWYSLSKEDREKYNQKKLQMEEKIYGKSILELPERMQKVWEKLASVSDGKKFQQLAPEDQIFWRENILSYFQVENQKSEKTEHKEKKEQSAFIDEKHIFSLVEIALQLQGISKDELVKIQLSDTVWDVEERDGIYFVPNAWNEEKIDAYFSSINMSEKFKVIKQIKGTNSVWIISNSRRKIKLWAPNKEGKYDLKNSVLPVIFDHEIATHVNTGIANLANLNLKDSDRMDLEEGIAKLNETLAKGESLDDLYEAGIWDICQFFWETLDDNDLKRAVQIYYTLSGTSGSVEDRVRRIRNWVAIGEKGSRRKDLTYGNSKEIIKELEELSHTPEGREKIKKYIRAFYATKLGYDAIKNIDEMLEWIGKLSDLAPNYPVFAGKILYWKLFKGKVDRNLMEETDIRSMIESEEISYAQKKLLMQAFHIIKENMEIKD